jgi:hypothetical protein
MLSGLVAGVRSVFLPLVVSAGRSFIRYGTRAGLCSGRVPDRALSHGSRLAPGEGERMRAEDVPRYVELQSELRRRLEAEVNVARVVPLEGMRGQQATAPIEIEDAQLVTSTRVGMGRVDVGLFDALGVPILSGRGLRTDDADSTAVAVVVNRSFAQQVLNGRNVLGRRIRYLHREGHVTVGRWYEIVGVVENFPAAPMEPDQVDAKVYHAMPAGQLWGRLAVRVRGTTPAAFAPRLREITTALDPNILVRNVQPLDVLMREEHRAMRLGALGLGLLTLSIVMLSAAGIFALMSFTVAQRRREIGIRAALGANPRRLLASIFARAARQLGTGILVGVVLAVTLGVGLGAHTASSVVAVAVLMLLVGLAATLLPARRGWRIQPTEALKAE